MAWSDHNIVLSSKKFLQILASKRPYGSFFGANLLEFCFLDLLRFILCREVELDMNHCEDSRDSARRGPSRIGAEPFVNFGEIKGLLRPGNRP